ncbi:MAG TPA: hemolysin III family protein [Anaerolineales bacterium]|nr:hemolysin III family protein [Anaerolineales bacterium]
MSKNLREPFNGLSHLFGAIAAFFGQIALLIVSWPVAAKVVSVLIYGISLIALFSASATYHLAKVKPAFQQLLRKFDHSAIYVLIAGTYTPFCINVFTGFFRWGLLAVIWSFALIGIVINIFYINAPRWLSASVYVVMGWLCVSAVGQLSMVPASAVAWMLIGGIIYTLGAIVYATKLFNFVPGKFGFHEVWHIFVLLGAAAHFVAVMRIVIRPG